LPIVNILKAPPGTELFERMKREQRLTKDFAFEEGDTNIAPAMGEEKLLKGFLEVIGGIYPPEFAYLRLQQFFKNHRFTGSQVKIKPKIRFADFWLLFRVVFLVGIKDKDRKYFWKLIFWTYRFNPKFIDKAFFYGMMLYQMNHTYLHIRKQVEHRLNELKAA